MTEKIILDACCGGRMFWINKNNENVVFQDIRKEVLPLIEKYNRADFSVEPDVIGDFRKMNFADNSFKMVVFDPPHLFLGEKSWLKKKYGSLNETWYKDMKQGFNECWRVLDNYGTLIFKWNDGAINIKDIEPLFPVQPLIFNKLKVKENNTYWYVFMKIPEKSLSPKANEKEELK
jgi:SAM-dependent methyltransferase